MLRQAIALFPPENNKPTVPTSNNYTFEKGMTIKGKKNSKVKIIANKKKHNYWGNIFRRKRIMSEYFSDSAFGSQSDTKIELYNPWEDKDKMEKYRFKQFREYSYDENEIMPTNISFMHDPNEYNNNEQMKKKSNDNEQEEGKETKS